MLCDFAAGQSRRFVDDRRGSVLLLFSLSLVAILAFTGGAIDFGNAHRMRSKLQNALDAAALAAGREFDRGGSKTAAQEVALRVFQANMGANARSQSITLNIADSGGVITASAQTSVETFFLGILGMEALPVGATSQVTLAGGKMEVVLVLDNSGSMGGARLRALKRAAKQLTQTLFGANPKHDAVRIGVVPFAASVNVGPANANASWMDTAGRSSIHFENFDRPVTRFDLYRQLRGVRWEGCVEVRPSPHDVTDSTPTVSDGDSLFVPMFAPDEPDRGRSYSNNYLSDDGGTCSRNKRRGRRARRGGGRRGGGGNGRLTEEQAQERTCKY
ncbi:MAG: VWA domain-containing protein, partial [Alphaproteobacteria bacterium]